MWILALWRVWETPLSLPLLLQIGVLALIGRWKPMASSLGYAALLATAPFGATTGVLWLCAILLLCAAQRAPRSLGLIGIGLILWIKQALVHPVLPLALTPIPPIVLGSLGAAAGIGLNHPRLYRGLWVAFGVGLLHFARLPFLPIEQQPAFAAQLDILPWVQYRLRPQATPQTLATFILLDPKDDPSALSLGIPTALGLGWEPSRPKTQEIEVARALEARGRGGEALRLLKRYPRKDKVDWYLGILEATQGLKINWEGHIPIGSLVLDQGLDVHIELSHNGIESLEFLAIRPMRIRLWGRGSSYDGPPIAQVQIDNYPSETWSLEGNSDLKLPTVLQTGPHRLSLRFDNDLSGPDGDRNINVDRLEAFSE